MTPQGSPEGPESRGHSCPVATGAGKSNLDGILAATERGFREECFLGTEGEAPSPHDGVRVTMRQQRCGHPEPGLPAADGEANNGKDSRFLAPRSLDKDPGTPQTSSKSITTLRASAHTCPLSRTPQSLRVRVTECHADAAPESQLAGVRAQEPRAQAHHTLRGRAPSARLGACGLPSGLRLHDDRVGTVACITGPRAASLRAREMPAFSGRSGAAGKAGGAGAGMSGRGRRR